MEEWGTKSYIAALAGPFNTTSGVATYLVSSLRVKDVGIRHATEATTAVREHRSDLLNDDLSLCKAENRRLVTVSITILNTIGITAVLLFVLMWRRAASSSEHPRNSQPAGKRRPAPASLDVTVSRSDAATQKTLTARAITRPRIPRETDGLHGHRDLCPRHERHHVGGAERGRVGEAEVEVVEEPRLPAGRADPRVQLLRKGEVRVHGRAVAHAEPPRRRRAPSRAVRRRCCSRPTRPSRPRAGRRPSSSPCRRG